MILNLIMKKVEKNLLRKKLIEERLALSENTAIYNSEVIMNKILKLEEFNQSKMIMVYMDFKNEVRTRKFIEKCFSNSKRVCIPYVTNITTQYSTYEENIHSAQKRILPCEITDLEKDLEKGTYGIYEPRPSEIKVVDAKKIDLVIVPGVGFDVNKNRIGYGAGYYDRFLTKINSTKVAVAFELQVCEEIPVDEYDQTMDMIITEKRIIK